MANSRGASSSMRVMVSLKRSIVVSRPTVVLSRTVSVSPSSVSMVSTISTVTSAFSAAWVNVLIRCRPVAGRSAHYRLRQCVHQCPPLSAMR